MEAATGGGREQAWWWLGPVWGWWGFSLCPCISWAGWGWDEASSTGQGFDMVLSLFLWRQRRGALGAFHTPPRAASSSRGEELAPRKGFSQG